LPVAGLISAQLSQTTCESGSGISCNQGFAAPSPERWRNEGTGINVRPSPSSVGVPGCEASASGASRIGAENETCRNTPPFWRERRQNSSNGSEAPVSFWIARHAATKYSRKSAIWSNPGSASALPTAISVSSEPLTGNTGVITGCAKANTPRCGNESPHFS
jgi:hypothetical protein